MNPNLKKRIESINKGIIPEGYKKTKVGIVPVEWEAKQMKNICEINRGGSPRPIEDFLTDEENGINWIKIGDTSIDSKYITHTKEKIKPEGLKKTRQVFEGDFLLSNSMSYGRPYILKTSGCIHDGWLVISNYSAFFNLDFFYYLLCHNNIQRQYDTLSAGSGVQNLNKDLVAQVNICIPPLPEQQKIAEILGTQDKLIELQERKINQLKTLKKGYLQKMFPKKGSKYPELRFKGFTDAWEQRKVGDIVKSHNAGIYISKENYGSGVNIIGVGNIYDSDCVDGEIYRFAPVDDERFILDENDLIYGESSLVPEGIARTMYVTKKGSGTAFAWHTRRVKIDTEICNSHIATLELNYKSDVRNYLMKASTQTALTGMTTEGFFGATLSFPTLQEQEKISSLFTNLDNLITLHQRKLDEEKLKKKALMQLLLTGKVRCI